MQSADRILRCPCAGLFKAWALVGPRLYSVPLRVPRRFYVNSVLPPDNSESPAQTLGGLRVTRTLPFGREALNRLLDLADTGIRQLIALQRGLVGQHLASK